MINLFSKTDDFVKMINLLNQTDDFIKSEEIKAFPLCVSEFMGSRVRPDMTEVRVLVQFDTFRIPNHVFLKNRLCLPPYSIF